MPRATVRPLDADRPSAASHAPAQWQELRAPVGVFDAGIGSYAVARLIQQRYPWQDVIYLADRASFPYGGKTHAELGRVVGAAIARLADWGARAVVLASNAPSVMVLQELQAFSPVPVLGVYPPVWQALALSRSGEVALLGVASLVSSPQIAAYVQREAAGRAVRVVNASALVALVESGAFLSDAAGTQTQVHAFMQALLRQHPGVDVCTLSSTHLPWLRAFFEQAAPQVQFLDPAQSVVERLAALLPQDRPADGRPGRLVCMATESPACPLAGLTETFARLGVALTPHLAASPLPVPPGLQALWPAAAADAASRTAPPSSPFHPFARQETPRVHH